MYRELAQYLLTHQKVSLPGLGTLTLQRSPARYDSSSGTVFPPDYSLTWEKKNEIPEQRFFQWLAGKMNLTEEDAVSRFNEFVLKLKMQFETGHTLEWKGVGVFSKAKDGGVTFIPEHITQHEKEITVERIIKNDNTWMADVRRGQVDSGNQIHPARKHRTAYWLMVSVLSVLSITFIVVHFIKHGMNPGATGNLNPLKAIEYQTSYRK
ncbi:MAG: hypothetical protein N2747_01385 [Chitinophagaceae bacterium]|nr:hypothetical protein [Chitinophagaceae bacterium]